MKNFKMNITKKLIFSTASILMISLLFISIIDYGISRYELNRSNHILLKNAIETSLYAIGKNYDYTVGDKILMTSEEAKAASIATIVEFITGKVSETDGTSSATLSKSDAISSATQSGENTDTNQDQAQEATPQKEEDAKSGATLSSQKIEPVLSLGKNGYFFIVDSNGNVVFHPFLKDNLYELKAKDGRNIIQEMIEVAKNGGGELKYALSGENSSIEEGRTVYTKYFPEWDWVVTAVIYDSDLFRGPDRIFKINLLSFGLILLLSLFIIVIIARRITSPIKAIARNLHLISEGDLTVDKITLKANDETRLLAESANQLVERFREITLALSESSNQLFEFSSDLKESYEVAEYASAAIAEASLQIADSSDSQVKEIYEGVSKMDLLSEDIKQTAMESKKARVSANDTLKLKEEGIILVEGLKEASIENRQTSNQLQHAIVGMNEQMKKIDSIVTVIAEIADQTNLLALNASIEAARVGEEGKGFAVVAGEIRILANETAKAVENISAMVNDVQTKSKEAVSYVDKNVVSVSKIDETVTNTEQAFYRIAQNLNEMVKDIESIEGYNSSIDDKKDNLSFLLKELSKLTEEVSSSIEEVTASSKQHNEIMKNIANSIMLLHKMAESLNQMIAMFRL